MNFRYSEIRFNARWYITSICLTLFVVRFRWRLNFGIFALKPPECYASFA